MEERERLELVRGDIVRTRADAIVTAANRELAGGGGVDGAVHRAAGPRLLEALRPLAPCPTGDAVATPSFGLREATGARHVIHAVGPVWRGGHESEDDLLASAWRRALALARELDCRSVAFPAISTGAYGFPVPPAARTSLLAVRHAFADGTAPERVIVVLAGDEDLAVWRRAADETFAETERGGEDVPPPSAP